MRLAILGATGQTGLEAVKQALASDHSVTALVRTPSKLTVPEHPKLKIVEADVFNQEQLTSHLKDHDAVLSCLGFKPQNPAVTGYLEVTKNVVAAMKANNIKRLVVCHSWYTEQESRGQAFFLIRWILLPMIRTVLDNMYETEVWLEEQEDIDFTVVRPAGLANWEITEKEFQVTEGGYDVKGAAGRIGRADVARFMLGALGKENYYRKQLAIAV